MEDDPDDDLDDDLDDDPDDDPDDDLDDSSEDCNDDGDILVSIAIEFNTLYCTCIHPYMHIYCILAYHLPYSRENSANLNIHKFHTKCLWTT